MFAIHCQSCGSQPMCRWTFSDVPPNIYKHEKLYISIIIINILAFKCAEEHFYSSNMPQPQKDWEPLCFVFDWHLLNCLALIPRSLRGTKYLNETSVWLECICDRWSKINQMQTWKRNLQIKISCATVKPCFLNQQSFCYM